MASALVLMDGGVAKASEIVAMVDSSLAGIWASTMQAPRPPIPSIQSIGPKAVFQNKLYCFKTPGTLSTLKPKATWYFSMH